ncbi:MAG: hypothetical protein KF722_03740 [Nitrospira sp.]|nr:hypothetical protein [Nitrospira sp.]
MIQSRSPVRSQPRSPVAVTRTLARNQARYLHRRTTAGFLLIVMFWMLTPSLVVAEGKVSPTLLADVVSQRADQLTPIDSDARALQLFTTEVGPALGLKDAAAALGAKKLPGKMVKDLGLAELSQSVHELMAALAAWQFADSIRHDAGPSSAVLSLSAARQEWLLGRSRSASLSDLLRLTQEEQTLRTSQTTSNQHNTELLLAAERTVFEASQRATATWWEIHGWKERTRQAKGRARLCGTWQWTIHNHQHHDEQKNTLVFPPEGQVPANVPAPSEIMILGDSIYLRWEYNGHIQEDSLLFTKDNTKIEGSFANSLGGWGSITGKRLAACKP